MEKEVRDLPEDIQCILAEPEPEFQLPAFQEPLSTASWGEERKQATRTFLNLDSALKSKDLTLSTKVRTVKVMVFLVVIYGCESWIIKKAELQRIDVFELWHWRRLLRVPWTAKRSNQSILKEINPEYSLKQLFLKLKLNTLAT